MQEYLHGGVLNLKVTKPELYHSILEAQGTLKENMRMKEGESRLFLIILVCSCIHNPLPPTSIVQYATSYKICLLCISMCYLEIAPLSALTVLDLQLS
jgi:hypothetical protein